MNPIILFSCLSVLISASSVLPPKLKTKKSSSEDKPIVSFSSVLPAAKAAKAKESILNSGVGSNSTAKVQGSTAKVQGSTVDKKIPVTKTIVAKSTTSVENGNISMTPSTPVSLENHSIKPSSTTIPTSTTPISAIPTSSLKPTSAIPTPSSPNPFNLNQHFNKLKIGISRGIAGVEVGPTNLDPFEATILKDFEKFHGNTLIPPTSTEIMKIKEMFGTNTDFIETLNSEDYEKLFSHDIINALYGKKEFHDSLESYKEINEIFAKMFNFTLEKIEMNREKASLYFDQIIDKESFDWEVLFEEDFSKKIHSEL